VTAQPIRTADFPPLRNGLDFVHSALEHLQDASDPRGLKYATLHLWSGVEILLKVRLQQEHWTLVFAEPKNATSAEYEAGTFKSVAFEDCLTRLAGIAGVTLSDSDRRKLKALQTQRNRFEHFGLVASFQAVQGSAASALSVVLDAILPELEHDLFGDQDRALLAEIRQMLGSIDAVVEKRWRDIRSKVDAVPVVLTCLECSQPAAVPEDGLRCLFCAGYVETSVAVERYARDLLGFCEYTTIKDGGESPIRVCPNCENETLVDGEHAGGRWQYVCFSCGEAWAGGDLDHCGSCGELYVPDDCAVCDNCLSRAASRDD
jgi:hypothetical protein